MVAAAAKEREVETKRGNNPLHLKKIKIIS